MPGAMGPVSSKATWGKDYSEGGDLAVIRETLVGYSPVLIGLVLPVKKSEQVRLDQHLCQTFLKFFYESDDRRYSKGTDNMQLLDL